MSINPLELKFGTATFFFRDVEQMSLFLGSYCFRDKQGRIWFFHGITFFSFTELEADYMQNVPQGVEWLRTRRSAFFEGECGRNIK